MQETPPKEGGFLRNLEQTRLRRELKLSEENLGIKLQVARGLRPERNQTGEMEIGAL